jgi:hypothetical protein
MIFAADVVSTTTQILDEQVNSVGDVKDDAVVSHGHEDFAPDRKSALPQFMRETDLIRRLEQSRSKP